MFLNERLILPQNIGAAIIEMDKQTTNKIQTNNKRDTIFLDRWEDSGGHKSREVVTFL
jgi:hypothetical protein